MAPEHFQELRNHLKVPFIRTGQGDRLKVRVYGLQSDFRMTPRIPLHRPFTFVTFDGVTLAGLRIDLVSELDEDGLALPAPFNRGAEETPGTVRDRRLHGPADDLGGEHPSSQPMA